MRNDAVAPIELDALLGRVGVELSSAAATLSGLQTTLGDILVDTKPLSPEVAQDLQGLDSVEQVLTSLSALMSRLGASFATIAHTALDPMLDDITLSALAQRLRGETPVLAPAYEVSGELDLF